MSQCVVSTPYVYSEVSKIDLSTNIEYSDIVTLDRIGKTDFRYHVEYPEGARSVKHVIVKKTDYEAIKSILAMFGEVSYESYLKVFGHEVSEPTDVAIDKFQAYGFDTNIHVYTATDYLLMGGVVTETGDIDPANFKCIEFQTRPAGVCPNDIQVSITTTSTTASISLTPDPEITDYRVYVDKKMNSTIGAAKAKLRYVQSSLAIGTIPPIPSSVPTAAMS